jgi:hypothetical protein
VRILLSGAVLTFFGIPGLLIANAHRPEYNCGASVTACEHGQTLTAIPGRFSEAPTTWSKRSPMASSPWASS